MKGKRRDFVKRLITTLLVVWVVLLFNSYILAVIAHPSPFFVTQGDGQKIKVVKIGDEWNNWMETMNGYSIERNKSGWWIYSGTLHIKVDGLVVGHDDPTEWVKKHYRKAIRKAPVRYGKPYALMKPNAVTNHNFLVILVEFSDQSPIGSNALKWSNRVFPDTTGSLHNYYKEISYGQFLISPASESHGTVNDGIVGWLNVGYNHPDTRGNTDDRNRQLTKDAILAADTHVDFSSFDSNGDGYISVTELGIVVVAAGFEGAFAYNTPSLWGHKWSLDAPGGTVPAPTCDGVQVAQWMGIGDPRTGGYMQYGEWHQSTPTDGRMATIGVMAHELGHDAFGLPDLYDYDNSSFGIGVFGLMAAGPWGQKSTDPYPGITPVHMCAWAKEFCGFVNPITPPTSGTCSVREASQYPDIYKFATSDANQYFLVENRQLSGYDKGLETQLQTTDGGLAIWHIDMSKLYTTNNDNESQKLVDLEEAEGNNELDLKINIGDREDLFYQGNNDSFTDSTVPDSKLYNGTSTNIAITSVSQSGPTMTFFSSTPYIPQIAINRSNLNFGSTSPGFTTSSQRLVIRNSGSGTLNWSVTDNVSWLTCTPSSGTNAGLVYASVSVTGLTAGTYTGTITVSDPNASNSPQTVSVLLTVYNAGVTTIPFGVFSTPIDNSTVRSSIAVTGWALDDIEVVSLKIYRNPVSGEGSGLIYIGDAIFVEGALPTVAQAFPNYPKNSQAGWGYMMLTNFLPNGGNGTFAIHAVAADKEGNKVTLGTKTITVDNVNAVKPFGAIDRPLPGQFISGNSYRNSGWALTPQPNWIPTDGSTINVLVDGVSLGNTVYNIYRSDIAALFPGYFNSNGAHAYFDFNTTVFSSGIHTIAWIAVDSAGNADGIGSRFFWILNPGGKRAGAGSASRIHDFSNIRVENLDNLPLIQNVPVRIKKGFGKAMEEEEIYPDHKGLIKIEVKELECIELDLLSTDVGISQISGYMVVGDRFQSLPVGATLEPGAGKFYWLLGPGFFGEYRFVFIGRDQDSNMVCRSIIVKVVPKFE
jgi:M6 family metalloprotease-like protein